MGVNFDDDVVVDVAVAVERPLISATFLAREYFILIYTSHTTYVSL